MSSDKQVLVVGGGIAGISVALDLARLNIHVELLEKEPVLGGHARQLTCKATDQCVQCGACVVEEKLRTVLNTPYIRIYPGARIHEINKNGSFVVRHSDQNGFQTDSRADAIVVASGFSAFDPKGKPYGYGRFENVITTLDLENRLRRDGRLKRPSDQTTPKHIAFVQCVGSRDETLNHLWCSKVCCGSALRMAKLIQSRQPEIEISVFYMDIQSFGRDFQGFFNGVKNDIRLIRAIPGDVFRTKDDGLKTAYFESVSGTLMEACFDMIILSVGLTPGKDLGRLAAWLKMPLSESGFVSPGADMKRLMKSGVFVAGTVLGPMNIEESVSSAGRTALDVATYLGI